MEKSSQKVIETETREMRFVKKQKKMTKSGNDEIEHRDKNRGNWTERVYLISMKSQQESKPQNTMKLILVYGWVTGWTRCLLRNSLKKYLWRNVVKGTQGKYFKVMIDADSDWFFANHGVFGANWYIEIRSMLFIRLYQPMQSAINGCE